MLDYEAVGFLEVEASDIEQLCRSKGPVQFRGEGKGYAVNATLCCFHVNARPHCAMVFHVKALKRGLVFSVGSPGQVSPWQYGYETLTRLGYELEDVNLTLSPAMLEVVLRDVPGLVSPARARILREDTSRVLAERQKTIDQDPESAAGRKAAQQLGAEKRIDEQFKEVCQGLLEAVKQRVDNDADSRDMLAQVNDLAARLEAAEARANEERRQREASEAITGAAEKRIRELEETLVDLETRSSEVLKAKQTVDVLQDRVKGLEAELERVSSVVEKERDRLEKSKAELKEARQRIVTLEDDLQKNEGLLADRCAELAEQQALKKEFETAARKAEQRIAKFEASLEATCQEAQAQAPVSEQAGQVASLRAEREQLQGQLDAEQIRTAALEQELDQAHVMIDSLETHLREATVNAEETKGENQRLAKLETQLEWMAEQLEQERVRQRELAGALAVAEGRLREPVQDVLVTPSPERAPHDESRKSLPHELRPAPKPAALFHPNWDLEGLPCQSGDQVAMAWESAFNVQISLEGYPSQYCMAFLVVLEHGKTKELFVVFRLRKSKHTLVCVPAKSPKTKAELDQVVQEALQFLRKSGFEMAEMPRDYIDSTLGSYFLER